MPAVGYFETRDQEEWGFPEYVKQTHNDLNRSLKSMKTILNDYIDDLNEHSKKSNNQVKRFVGNLKSLAKYSDMQLQAISSMIDSPSQPQQPQQVFHVYGDHSINGNINTNIAMAPASDNVASNSSADNEDFESLFSDYRPTEAENPPVGALEFRDAVFQAGISKENSTITVSDLNDLRKLLDRFTPHTLGEKLDCMAAELVLKGDLKDTVTIMALKLSLSRMFSSLNDKVKNVYKKYFDQDIFDVLHTAAPIPPQGLSTRSKDVYKEVLKNAKTAVAPKSFLTRLQVAICMKKLETYQNSPEETEILQVLDVLANLASNVPEETPPDVTKSSELTWYRKSAQLLDIILKDTPFSIDDGERICKASKDIMTQNKRFQFTPKNTTFGRRIDLILTASHVEMCTNEWKREDAHMTDVLKQQSKNTRMNKAVLASLLQYPLDDDQKSRLATLSIDMTGPRGYLFYCYKYEDVFVVKNMVNFRFPPGLDQLDAFLDSLDTLYKWKNHHLSSQAMLIPAITKLKDSVFYSQVTADTDGVLVDSDGYKSPNIYFTPAKRRKTGSRSTDTEDEAS